MTHRPGSVSVTGKQKRSPDDESEKFAKNPHDADFKAVFSDDEKAGEVTMTPAERIERRGEMEQRLRKVNLKMLQLFGDSVPDFRDLKEAEKCWDDKSAKS